MAYWNRTARSVFTGAGLKWLNMTGWYNTFLWPWSPHGQSKTTQSHESLRNLSFSHRLIDWLIDWFFWKVLYLCYVVWCVSPSGLSATPHTSAQFEYFLCYVDGRAQSSRAVLEIGHQIGPPCKEFLLFFSPEKGKNLGLFSCVEDFLMAQVFACRRKPFWSPSRICCSFWAPPASLRTTRVRCGSRLALKLTRSLRGWRSSWLRPVSRRGASARWPRLDRRPRPTAVSHRRQSTLKFFRRRPRRHTAHRACRCCWTRAFSTSRDFKCRHCQLRSVDRLWNFDFFWFVLGNGSLRLNWENSQKNYWN